MNDLDDLLVYGLNQIGDRARPVDLDRRVTTTARSIHRRRVVTRTIAVLATLAVAMPIAAAIVDRLNDESGTPPIDRNPTPTIRSAPWISGNELADLTGFPGWQQSPTSVPTVCDASAEPLRVGGTPVNSGGYLIDLGGTDTRRPEMIAYTLVRYDSKTSAGAAYQALDDRMQGCGAPNSDGAAFQVVDGWTLTGWEAAGLRQREQLVRRDCSACADRYRSTMILLWDRYLATASWTVRKQPDAWEYDGRRAGTLDQSLLSAMSRGKPASRSSASEQAATLGPDGFAGVALGMTPADALASGQLDVSSILRWRGAGACTGAQFAERPGAAVWLSKRLGTVVAIDGERTASTPEGLLMPASEAEFKSTYPDFRQDQLDRLSAIVPGNPAARFVADLVHVGLDAGTGRYQVESLKLVSSVQDDCVNWLLGIE
jgi:hypothetical protein